MVGACVLFLSLTNTHTHLINSSRILWLRFCFILSFGFCSSLFHCVFFLCHFQRTKNKNIKLSIVVCYCCSVPVIVGPEWEITILIGVADLFAFFTLINNMIRSCTTMTHFKTIPSICLIYSVSIDTLARPGQAMLYHAIPFECNVVFASLHTHRPFTYKICVWFWFTYYSIQSIERCAGGNGAYLYLKKKTNPFPIFIQCPMLKIFGSND